MERTITLLLSLLLACVVTGMGLLIAFNPTASKETILKAKIADIKPVVVEFNRRELDVESVQKRLAAKPGLWKELLEPPPPPAPPPPPPPPIEKMAEPRTFGRQKIGDKIKVTKGGDPKGTFVAVGDKINGLSIKEITKTSVVLSLTWEGKELTVTKERK